MTVHKYLQLCQAVLEVGVLPSTTPSAAQAHALGSYLIRSANTVGPAVRRVLAGSAKVWHALTGSVIGPKLGRRSFRGWLSFHGLPQVELAE